MNKLLIVSDYNENYNENFVAHFDEFMKDKNIDYKILLVDVKSKKKLKNLGKGFNIGFLHATNTFKHLYGIDYDWDYVVFHRSDFIPLSEECDYSFDERPKCLVGSVDEVSFGIHPDFIPDAINLPSRFFFNGALMFTKKEFENLGGFYNNFWGDGYEDLHMIWKMGQLNYPMKKHTTKPVKKTSISLSFNSYGKVESTNKSLKNLFNGKSFSINCWCRLDKDILKEGYVISKAGYHTGIKFSKETQESKTIYLSSNVWTFKDEYVRVGDYPIEIGEWVHVALSYSEDNRQASMFINGSLHSSVNIPRSLKRYPIQTPIFIGCATDERHTSNSKCEVSISDLSFYDSFLNENSIKKIYDNGNFGKDGYTIEQPVAQYDFSSGYKNMIWDESGNLNFIIFNDFSTPKKNVLKEGDVLYLPIRDRGSYGYIGNEYDKLNKENYVGSNSENNYKTLNKLINDKIKDDLSECRFRVVKMEQYFENHAIIVTQA
tara:strand:+ start:165 stop:1631 length:1467 start_codon:yes stop_codon:yes gene_type:complete